MAASFLIILSWIFSERGRFFAVGRSVCLRGFWIFIGSFLIERCYRESYLAELYHFGFKGE